MNTTQPIRDKKDLLKFRNYYKEAEPQPRNYALIVLGLNSALRISDLLSLRWSDLYSESSSQYYNHITVIEEKTGKHNTFILNESSREALEHYRHSLAEPTGETYLFASQKAPHGPITRYQAFRVVKKAALSCGLKDCISCHSLRKTFGYYAWRNGIPPALLMSIYNHSSYEITKHYLCIDQLEKDEVYRKTYL